MRSTWATFFFFSKKKQSQLWASLLRIKKKIPFPPKYKMKSSDFLFKSWHFLCCSDCPAPHAMVILQQSLCPVHCVFSVLDGQSLTVSTP